MPAQHGDFPRLRDTKGMRFHYQEGETGGAQGLLRNETSSKASQERSQEIIDAMSCLFVSDAWLGRIFTNEILQSLTSGGPLYTVFDREDAAPVCQENISDGSNFQDYWLQSLWHVHWIASNGDAAAIC